MLEILTYNRFWWRRSLLAEPTKQAQLETSRNLIAWGISSRQRTTFGLQRQVASSAFAFCLFVDPRRWFGR